MSHNIIKKYNIIINKFNGYFKIITIWPHGLEF